VQGAAEQRSKDFGTLFETHVGITDRLPPGQVSQVCVFYHNDVDFGFG
jgi:hypothetical protein